MAVRTNNVEEIEASALVKGDRVQVRPSDQIPGDGIVTEGVSSVNQAAITGESLPVGKKPGDAVFKGQRLFLDLGRQEWTVQ